LLLRIALKTGVGSEDEDEEFFRSRFPEFFASLDDELAVCEKALGEIYHWLAAKVDLLPKRSYKNKTVKQHFESDELQEVLYEDGLEFRTDYPVSEDDIYDRFKKPSSVIKLLRQAKSQEDIKAVAATK
jgi:hypothetical protein